MNKNKQSIISLILFVCFVISVVVCGYYILKLDSKEKELANLKEDITQIKYELNKKEDVLRDEENTDTSEEESKLDVDSLNEKYSKRIINILGSGYVQGQYFAVMGIEENQENFDKYNGFNEIKKNNYTYKITDVSFDEYEKEWKSYISESLMKELIGCKTVVDYSDAIINVNGKVAINNIEWVGGIKKTYLSQKLISKNENVYAYEVKYKSAYGIDPADYEEKVATVTGKVENGKYIIESFQTK